LDESGPTNTNGRKRAMDASGVVAISAALVSVVLLVVGFRKDDRRILLAAWLCLLIAMLAAGFTEITEGFAEGYNAGRGLY
jgi:hypothetical protein